jgi:FlaA1/EpsC-like NDP-sugar epimerase
MRQLELIGRQHKLFKEDLMALEEELSYIVSSSKFLVVGGAGSIGKSVVQQILLRKPDALYVVDLSENELVELVRVVRSSIEFEKTNIMTFAIDVNSNEFSAMFAAEGPFDFVLNLSALKHVRSESDPYTLMRMSQVNIINSINLLRMCEASGCYNYFCVSTDKAANPVNFMGASKRIMEMALNLEKSDVMVTKARFANVAFSKGSLLEGFMNRISQNQPITAPYDITRYFITAEEAGQLCLLSCIFGNDGEIFFPKESTELKLTSFVSIAEKIIKNSGFEPHVCSTEIEARHMAKELIKHKRWPCYFFASDTTGEKPYEEFYSSDEILDLSRFKSIGVINEVRSCEEERLRKFLKDLNFFKAREKWTKLEILDLYKSVLPTFDHADKGKSLNERM